MLINVLEVRNYLLRPGVREHFIDNFEANLIVPQEEHGMTVLGQFRVVGEPDRFVFLRSFVDMQTRLDALQRFYGGAFWKQFGPLPNSLLIDSDNVHLLCPLHDGVDLTCGNNAAHAAAELANGTISPDTGMIVIDFFQAKPGQREELIEKFQSRVAPLYERESIQLRGSFVAEMSENTYPRLPVIQDANELVVITAYESEGACREKRGKVAQNIDAALNGVLSGKPTTLLLNPTLRSPLRYLHRQAIVD